MGSGLIIDIPPLLARILSFYWNGLAMHNYRILWSRGSPISWNSAAAM